MSRQALLRWFEPRRWAYPWRGVGDPYRVLVSEVMLQQTQAARVVPAYERFVARFPTVRDLAAASRADVVREWGTLGYNRRAVALSEAARAIVERHAGEVPATRDDLLALPGIGPYTAAAVAALAFGEPVAAVDTNLRRVIRRAWLGDDAAAAAETDAVARRVVDRRDPSSWNQAVMDLGREVCRPRPRCDECPLRRTCRFRRSGAAPAPPARRQGRFEGSTRQLRGAIVRRLRAGPATTQDLVAATAADAVGVVAAVRALEAEGLVAAGRAALAGHPSGRVRLRP